MGEEAAEADERGSGAGSGCGAREFGGLWGGQLAMEVEAAGETCESLFVFVYYFILIILIHLSFILFDHYF